MTTTEQRPGARRSGADIACPPAAAPLGVGQVAPGLPRGVALNTAPEPDSPESALPESAPPESALPESTAGFSEPESAGAHSPALEAESSDSASGPGSGSEPESRSEPESGSEPAAGSRSGSELEAESAGGDLVDAVAAELRAIASSLARLRDVDWWRLPGAALLTAAADVEAALRSGFGVQARLAGEISDRSMYGLYGERSAPHLLAHTLRIPVGQAKARIMASVAAYGTETITGQTLPPEVDGLAEAIDSGDISDEHARVVTGCAAKIPAAVDADTRALCHQVLVTEARRRDPSALRSVADQIQAICDPDGTLSGKDPVGRAELILGRTRADGLTPLRGLLDALSAEQLRVALEDLAAPKPIDQHTPDRRPAALRNAHAFGEILTRYLATRAALPDGPPGGLGSGIRPTVAITITAQGARTWADRPCADRPCADRPFADRPSADLPSTGGPCADRPCADWPRPDGGSGASHGRFDYGGPASAATASMLICDGHVIRQVLSADGSVLDQGRAVRLFTRAQRRALITRDRGCAFPGCDIPAGWCEAHHITYWSEGGPTDLANGVLLCRRHHTVIHQGHWRIQPDPDDARARPWFVPPAHIDPGRKPRRGNNFHMPEALATIKSVVRRT